ncbi:Hypothetical predicted protein [Mytilus galloprovincialis]|uniref:Uncharacterized protein n=1 Tax=Mytilus galloprovincialis TaxID=29158 RepID=A0A8B6C199_MYTGA|nr:Hypothetical predicted protein [Mytilus galloprovincialis]
MMKSIITPAISVSVQTEQGSLNTGSKNIVVPICDEMSMLMPHILTTNADFSKKHNRQSSKDIKIARKHYQDSCKAVNITNLCLTIGCLTCVVYILTYYYRIGDGTGLVGKYHLNKLQCSKNNATCDRMPWIIKSQDSTQVSYDTKTRKLRILQPGSYFVQLSLNLDLSDNNDNQVRFACIKTHDEEKCGRFDRSARQVDVSVVIKT